MTQKRIRQPVQHKNRKASGRSRTQDLPLAASPTLLGAPGLVRSDPQMLLDVQQSVGNQATERLLHEAQPQARHTGSCVQVLRQVAENENAAAAEPAPAIDPARLGLESALPGHADKGEAQPAGEPAGAPAPAQPAAAGSGVEVALTALSPDVDRSKSAAQIAAAHGQVGAAGWTTPRYRIVVPTVEPFHIDVDVTLGFGIELASEYKGAALQVLSDHEGGHVAIGTEKAQQHLVGDLKGYLEGLPGFTQPAQIQQGFRDAASVFNSEEGLASRAYDAGDYPRMEQAYRGAVTPLADLEKTVAPVAAAAGALRGFLALQPPLGRELLRANSQAVIDACDALEDDATAMLQYNPEFKALVDRAAAAIGLWSVWLDKAVEPDAAATGKLDVLAVVLESFDWKPPV
jgi:hypothetical protein